MTDLTVNDHHVHVYCKPKLLSAKTLLWNLRKMDWITATIIHNENVDYLDNNIPETFNHWFTAKNICYDTALANLAKFS